MSNSVAIADQFKGLPMEDLIGGPLSAAVKASFNLAKSTADFVNTVGFDGSTYDSEGKVIPGKVRNVDFGFERESEDGSLETVLLKVPFLTIVPIPSLQLDTVDISFNMEVKSAVSDNTKDSKSGSLEANASVGWGPFKADVKISGSISSSTESTRSTDTSAKYNVQIKGSSRPLPEGLSRVLDIMNQGITPIKDSNKKSE